MKFMISTPIYYVNAPPHMGHFYCSLAADVIARWRRQRGDEVFFLTGTDEHGANIEKLSAEAGITPGEFVDRMAAEHIKFAKDLGISNDDFIRTTEDRHVKSVQEFWRRIASGKAPDGGPTVTKGEYEGWYCRPCEAYFLEGDLVGGNCPDHKLPVEKVKEESYFFRLSGFQKYYEDLFAAEEKKAPGDRFIVPETRFNEVRGLVREGLRDVAATRTKVKWGIPVPDDPKHVIHVWYDAVMNYTTAAGFPHDMQKFGKYWPADMHLIGKEIIRFHALMWPAMLIAAGFPLPGRIVAHGWWTVDGEKISKTRGNGIDPRDLAAKYSLDAVRYYLMREISFGADGDYSEKKFIERYNADLANDFGNLAHRTISMSFRYLVGKLKRPATSPWRAQFEERWKPAEHPALYAAIAEGEKRGLSPIQAALEALTDRALAIPQPQDVLMGMWEMVKRGNLFCESCSPWNKTVQEQEETLGRVLELLEAISWPLMAFIPDAAGKLRERLGVPRDRQVPLPDTFELTAGDPLFPRIDTKKPKDGSAAK